MQNPNCPCPYQDCPQHGNCVECRKHHAGKDYPPRCQMPPESKEAPAS